MVHFYWRICRGEEGPRLPVHLSSPLTNIVFLPILHTYNLHFLARHAILPNKCLLQQAVKNVDQSPHTSRSGTSLRNFPRDSRKDQKGLMKGEDLTLTPKTPLWANDSLYRQKWSHCWSPTFLFGTKLFDHVSHTPHWACTSCLACQHSDFNSVHRFSDNLHMNSSCKFLFANKGKGI